MKKYSIVIPTYNHCEDLLKPCIESILKYTDMTDTEIIVSANGCTDNTFEYITQLNNPDIILLWSQDALGYTTATNSGIKIASGEFIVLMNNDTILIPQEKNQWIDLLLSPFTDENVGITGPVRFDWDCGGLIYEAMAFWLVMIRKSVFDKIGILDEIYSPGMGEDGDFCIRAVQAGFSLVSVPNDVKGHFDTGIKNFEFPIYHVGNGTFADDESLKTEIIDRNNKILANKYGKKIESNVGRWVWYRGEQNKVPYGDVLTYKLGAEFLKDCITLEDWGCGTCFMSTVLPSTVSYTGVDGSYSKYANKLADLVTYRSQEKPDGIFLRHVLEHNNDWEPILENAVASFGKKLVLVLFTPINTKETYTITTNVEIGVPDISFNMVDILSKLNGLKFSVEQHVTHTQYGVEYIFYIEKQDKEINTTIVIPTYNHLEDALRPCLDNVLSYTDMIDKEVIVVANGCTDGTKEYLESKGKSIRYIWLTDPCGYIRAVNWGIASNNSKRTVLLDNDSILLEQQVNHWINVLEKPFIEDSTVGASSPFAHIYEGMELVVHSGCTMYNTSLLKNIGMFDEIYNPGYLSDSDVSMKVWKAGYRCVEVPEYIGDKRYENGVFTVNFPVYHSGLVQTMNKAADVLIIEKNRRTLYARYGRKKYSIVIPTFNHCDDLLKPCIESIIKYTDTDSLEVIVVANGCTDNTREYIDSLGDFIKLIWVDEGIGYTKATNLGIKVATGEYVIPLNNDTEFLIQVKNDWLRLLEEPFSDPTVGMTGVLELYDPSVESKFLVFFCVMVRKKLFDELGLLDEIFSPGFGEDIDFCQKLLKAGHTYKCVNTVYYDNEGRRCTTYPIWHKDNQTFKHIPEYGKEIVHRNSAILAQRYGKKMKKYSVVIPTYNHCDDLLRPLIDSIVKYTDLDNIEFIIVANGCTDNTRAYVESLGAPFRLVWSEEAIGYTKATNLGIKECNSEFVILLNNDTELLPQHKNSWLDILVAPFVDEKVGMVGPLQMFDTYSNHHVLIFFCVMIRKKLFDELGLLDEIYSPGGGEDIDFTIRAHKAGYKTLPTSIPTYTPSAGTNVGDFPIWHKDNQTFKHIPEYTKTVIKVNGLLNCRRYNDNLKLNIGAGGVDVPGFLSVDLYDRRALIKMDITKLEFDDNSATELMASHVFEHLNPYHSVDILKDWLRILKPGGKLSMEMPDIEKSCHSFINNKEYYARMGVVNVIYGSVNTTGEGGPDNITSPHLFGWWPESMFNHLQVAGYVDISFPSEQWPHPGDNFRVEAYKPSLSIDRESLRQQEPMTYQEIFDQNSYGVETIDVRGKQVVDIGGNLGMFSLFCVEKGASRIICVEAQPVIFSQGLLNNVKPYPMITPLNYAVSDEDGKKVHILNEHVGSKVGGDVGEMVETIKLESLLEQQNILGDDLVLKLDCEGSEFNILLPASVELLRRFSVVYMELHSNTNPNPIYKDTELLVNKMVSSGFERVKDGGIVGYNSDGTTTQLGVFVQKWVRV